MKNKLSIKPIGLLRIRGKDRIDLLERLSTNDLKSLKTPYSIVSTIFTTHKGKIVDWVSLLSFPEELFMITSRDGSDKMLEWIEQYTIMEDVHIENITNLWGCVLLDILQKHDINDICSQKDNTFIPYKKGYCYQGFDVYDHTRVVILLPSSKINSYICTMLKKEFQKMDTAYLEYTRLKAGIPSPHFEFKKPINPLELRLKKYIDWHKGCYIGQEVISRLYSYDKTARYLIGFTCEKHLNTGDELKITFNNKSLGIVSSFQNRENGSVIGLAIIKKEFISLKSAEIVLGSTRILISLSDRPFWSQ